MVGLCVIGKFIKKPKTPNLQVKPAKKKVHYLSDQFCKFQKQAVQKCSKLNEFSVYSPCDTERINFDILWLNSLLLISKVYQTSLGTVVGLLYRDLLLYPHFLKSELMIPYCYKLRQLTPFGRHMGAFLQSQYCGTQLGQLISMTMTNKILMYVESKTG